MSLYNMLFGVNINAGLLLKILGIEFNSIPRFRDCFIKDGKIVIHTRTGGGNRDYYDNKETHMQNCDCEEGDECSDRAYNDDLRENTNYLYDEDDDFDCTYANFYFKFPEEYREDLEKSLNGEEFTPSEKWKLLFESLGQENKP